VNARRLLTALFLSLVAHMLLMRGEWLPMPVATGVSPSLVAQIVELPAPRPALRADAKTERPPSGNPRRPAQQHDTWAAPRSGNATTLAMAADDTAPEAEFQEESAPASGGAQITHAEAPPGEAGTDVSPPPALPANVQLSYTLHFGPDNFAVGRSVLIWKLERGSYQLISDSETTGLIEVFRPQRLTYTSEGKLTEQGLRPEIFAMSRTRRGRTDVARARLDWGARQLTYGRPAQQRIVELSSPSQDIVSFLFQLAHTPPPPGRIRLPITNGLRFETYELEVQAEERIETPLGVLNTLPLKQQRKEASEGIEVWLAVDYRYLPVKVRFIDRDGNPSGEQVVSEIRISQQ
jgi:hypothetical protein